MATRVQMNWLSVIFNSTTIGRITAGGFGQGGKLIAFSGDGDLFPTVIVNNMNDPHANFTTADIGLVHLIAPGTTGTLSATLGDAKGVSGGAVNYSMINSVFENTDSSGSHAQFGTASIGFLAYSSDGLTSPLSISRS